MQADRLFLIRSEDGSYTLKSARFEDTYHSIHGAIQESKHVFIDYGLRMLPFKEGNDIHIFEMGFGTGLNALLSLLEAQNSQRNINYLSLELYPISEREYLQLDYFEQLNCKPELFRKLHEVQFGQSEQICKEFSLLKLQKDLTSYEHDRKYDLVYFDAFSPSVQPELWTKAVFSPLFNNMNPKGRLVTYCAKGAFKRMLKQIGFLVESPPGPPGKREITVAVKP
jgi:tRNA U34 5-methylaminomethyl-2-thiouridine-forming methyltransferase MnmC